MRRPFAFILCMLLAVATGLLPATARAKSHARSARVSVIPSGHRLAVDIYAMAGGKCSLKVSAKRRSVMFTVWKLNRNGSGTIEWGVPKKAPSGTWMFVATCVKGKKTAVARAKIVLINHGSGNGSLASSGALGGGGDEQESCANIVKEGPKTVTGQQICFYGDPFATAAYGNNTGQCTWYAAGVRPDVDPYDRYDASTWLTYAKGHLPEGTTPQVGAIAVNVPGNHVAYVAGIEDGGSELILDEANVNYDGKVYLNIPTPTSEFTGYIYGSPAVNPETGGPLSTYTPPGGTSNNGSGGNGSGNGGAPSGLPPSPVGYATPVSFVDSSGDLNVFINSGSGINHYVKPPGGSWSGEVIAQGNVGSVAPDAFQAANGNLEVFINSGSGINHYEKAPGGSWGGEVIATGNVGSASPDAFEESNGTLDVFINSGSGINHYVKPPGGSWSGEIVAGG